MSTRLRPRPGRTYLAGTPMCVAHRGGAQLAPENTLAAFRSAVDDWGADMLELDVRLTRDGEVAVIHDDTVDRTTDESGVVSDRTMAELQTLDAGYRFTSLGGAFSFRGRDVRIPTLSEVLDACPDVCINVEAKDRHVAGPMVALIRERGEEHRVLVAAEHERNRLAVRGYPGPWGASRRDCALFWLRHWLPGGESYTPDVDIFQVPERFKGRRILTPRLIDEAHRRNIPVHVWTVNDSSDMRRLLQWGVDGIQTDRLDLLTEVLSSVTGRPPPPCQRRAAVDASP
jgi:glycerophosphoryl diester phosphodiesterase